MPQKQLPHLRIVEVRKSSGLTTVRTTGTVDWDADHTTQAITQVNGPISRLLVDTGESGSSEPAPAICIEPGRRQRDIDLQEGAQSPGVFEENAGPKQGSAGAQGDRQKDLEAAEQDYNDAQAEVENDLQALKIFGVTAAGDRRGAASGRRHQPATGRALADRRA